VSWFLGCSTGLTARDYFKEDRGIYPNVAFAGEQLLHNVESPVVRPSLLQTTPLVSHLLRIAPYDCQASHRKLQSLPWGLELFQAVLSFYLG
jgi:hypothetical protein